MIPKNRSSLLAILLGMLAPFLTACGAGQAVPTDPATQAPTQWSDVSTQSQPTLLPTETGQVSFEPTAAAAGKVPYSGYNCSLSTEACTCADATVISAAFTFQPGNKMIYEFRGDTYGAQWPMTRLAPNQWSYTIPIGADHNGGTPEAGSGHYFIVLTFTQDGFTLLQREELADGTRVTCPEVAYTRLSAVTPGP
jgi:hypothetical protein